MKQRDLPLHVFHFDCFWMREFEWTNFEWDPRVFPDPAGMLQRLHARGLKICVWINSYIAQRSRALRRGRGQGLFPQAQRRLGLADRSLAAGHGHRRLHQPAAREWFAGHLTRLLEMGVDCFKTDFGERIPTEASFTTTAPIR